MKEKELMVMQAKEAMLTCTKSEKRHHSGSESNDELNNKRLKKDSGSRDDIQTGGSENNRQRNMSKERESEKSSSKKSCKSNQVKTAQDDHHKGPSYDLRGLLKNKQMIKEIRHFVEQNQQSSVQGGDGCDDEVKHEGRWRVEPQYREDEYAFDPNDPVANPAWSSDLQVVLIAKN